MRGQIFPLRVYKPSDICRHMGKFSNHPSIRNSVTTLNMERLIHTIRDTPLIDNHAHPLLIPSAKTRYPLLSIVTEANGDALKPTHSSLAHIRATNQLADILSCPPTWSEVAKAIAIEKRKPGDIWAKRCLEGIQTVLLDDGLKIENDAFDYSWHSKLTISKYLQVPRTRMEAVLPQHGACLPVLTHY